MKDNLKIAAAIAGLFFILAFRLLYEWPLVVKFKLDLARAISGGQ